MDIYITKAEQVAQPRLRYPARVEMSLWSDRMIHPGSERLMHQREAAETLRAGAVAREGDPCR